MNQKSNISAINVPTGSLTIFPINLIYGESQLLLSLVLPTYNEAKNIPAIVEQLTRLLNSVISGQYE